MDPRVLKATSVKAEDPAAQSPEPQALEITAAGEVHLQIAGFGVHQERGESVTGRHNAQGEPLEAILVTKHLKFSLPYRALFARNLRPDTAERLIDDLYQFIF